MGRGSWPVPSLGKTPEQRDQQTGPRTGREPRPTAHPFAPESVAYPLAGNFCSAQHGRVSDEYDREAVKGGYGGEAAARTGMMISGVDSGRFRWRAAW